MAQPEFRPQEFLDSLLAPLSSFSFPATSFVQPGEVSEPSRTLLVHNHHMTVTLEAHYGSPLRVEVLERVRLGDSYTRRICLYETGKNVPVLYGVVRIHLQFCKDGVRERILAEREPLGRILIQNGVLTRIDLLGLLKIESSSVPGDWFGNRGGDVFGRLAVIHCDDQPAIELLEMV